MSSLVQSDDALNNPRCGDLDTTGTEGARTTVLPSEPCPDVSRWPTLQEAIGALNLSGKTVRRMIDRGELGSAKRKQPGLSPHIVVVHPEDLARAVEKRRPKPFVMPGAEGSQVSATGSFLPVQLEAIRRLGLLPPPDNRISGVSIKEKLFLTLAEASEYSGLPKAVLLREIGRFILPARKTGSGWRIRRSDLEKLS